MKEVVKIYRRYRPEQQIYRETAPPARPQSSHSASQSRVAEFPPFQGNPSGSGNREQAQAGTHNSISSKNLSAATTASQNGGISGGKGFSPSSNHGSAHSGQSSSASYGHQKSNTQKQPKQDLGQKCPPPVPPKSTPCKTDKKNQLRAPDLASLIHSFIPSSVYNPKTKKIFGVISAEDLLIIALIFLFLENDENNDPMMVIALIYILISDYIDLSDWIF